MYEFAKCKIQEILFTLFTPNKIKRKIRLELTLKMVLKQSFVSWKNCGKISTNIMIYKYFLGLLGNRGSFGLKGLSSEDSPYP